MLAPMWRATMSNGSVENDIHSMAFLIAMSDDAIDAVRNRLCANAGSSSSCVWMPYPLGSRTYTVE